MREFPLSSAEIDRRREAYTRLVSFIALGSFAASLDLLTSHRAAMVALLLLTLCALLLLSRTLFIRSFARYARTVWSISESRLMRNDETSSAEYALGDIERMRVKRTVAGEIRAIGIDIRHGPGLYVNALRTPQEFVDELVQRSGRAMAVAEAREPIDYDHPWFYRFLGLATGVAIATAVRIAVSTTALNQQLVYLAVAAYMIAFGAFWLYGMPVSRSYGEHKRPVDVAVGLCVLCAGIGLGILALVA